MQYLLKSNLKYRSNNRMNPIRQWACQNQIKWKPAIGCVPSIKEWKKKHTQTHTTNRRRQQYKFIDQTLSQCVWRGLTSFRYPPLIYISVPYVGAAVANVTSAIIVMYMLLSVPQCFNVSFSTFRRWLNTSSVTMYRWNTRYHAHGNFTFLCHTFHTCQTIYI